MAGSGIRRREWLRAAQVSLFVAGGVAAAALLWPRGGLEGTYSAEISPGRTFRLHSRIDPDLDFSTPHRLQNPFFQHWNLDALGVPRTLPPFLIRWRGFLSCRQGGRYRFQFQAAGQVRFLLDGRPFLPEPGREEEGAAVDLAPGWHRVDLTYRRSEEEPRFRFLWRPPASPSFSPVPRRVLSPAPGPPGGGSLRMTLGWLLTAGWLAAAWIVGRDGGRTGTLGEHVRRHRHGVALVGILLVALVLRLHEYDLLPFHHETADEYQHGWEGWTLLHQGVPAAWTFYPHHYPPAGITPFNWFGDSYYLARPYFDHPPGFSLLVGGVASLRGAEQMLDCTLRRMRLVPILLGVLTVFLVAWTGWALIPGDRAGTLAALIYATLPTLVLGNRLVKAESLLAPLLLIQSVLLARYLAGSRRGDLLRIAAVGAAALWSKATGVAVPLAAGLTLAMARRWRALAVVGGSVAAALAIYLAYGAFYGWDLFTAVLRLQSAKWVGLRTILDLTGISRVVELPFGAGWYLFLAIAAGWVALGRRRELLAPMAVYFVVLVASADQRGVFGWYRLPLYPYLCLAAGMLLSDWWRDRDIARGFLFAATALATTAAYVLPDSLGRTRIAVLILLGGVCLPPLWDRLRPSAPSRFARRWSVALALAAFFAGNAYLVWNQLPVYLAEAARGRAPALAGTPPLPVSGGERAGPVGGVR